MVSFIRVHFVIDGMDVRTDWKFVQGSPKVVMDKMIGKAVSKMKIEIECDSLHEMDKVVDALHSLKVCLVK